MDPLAILAYGAEHALPHTGTWNMGPVLFVCYINDMLDMTTSFVYMYADDANYELCFRWVWPGMSPVWLGHTDKLVKWMAVDF